MPNRTDNHKMSIELERNATGTILFICRISLYTISTVSLLLHYNEYNTQDLLLHLAHFILSAQYLMLTLKPIFSMISCVSLSVIGYSLLMSEKYISSFLSSVLFNSSCFNLLIAVMDVVILLVLIATLLKKETILYPFKRREIKNHVKGQDHQFSDSKEEHPSP